MRFAISQAVSNTKDGVCFYVFLIQDKNKKINKVPTRIKLGEEIFTRSKYVQGEVLKVSLSGTNRSVWGQTLN